jgi:DNA-binding beta-propeller fold protein YncE
MLALAIIPAAIGCSTPDNCPLCGTTQSGAYTAIAAMQVPQASPFGKPFAVWDIVVHDPAQRRLYVTDRSHAAIAVYDTKTDTPIGQIKGGFIGSVCCEPDRASNYNELSGPNATIVTPSFSGGTLGNLWVSDGDSTVKVFDLDKDTLKVDHLDGTASQTFATVPVGLPAFSIDDCGRGSTPINGANACGDFRADEMAYDPEHKIILVSNGDPGVPFVTLLDATKPACLNNSCVLGQIFFDGLTTGACTNRPAGYAAPPTNTPLFAGTPAPPLPGLCRHGPNAVNGIGGSIYNLATHRFLVSTSQVGPDPKDGEVTEINPLTVSVTGNFPLTGKGCQPAALAIGPKNNLLVGCANREGEAFFPSTYIMDVSTQGTGPIIKSIFDVGRVDEVWYNSGDQRFYLAARDMPNGSVLGVIDANTNLWLQNVPTGGNAHGLAVDPINNHIYIPIGANARCGRFSAEGCITIYAQQ